MKSIVALFTLNFASLDAALSVPLSEAAGRLACSDLKPLPEPMSRGGYSCPSNVPRYLCRTSLHRSYCCARKAQPGASWTSAIMG